MAINPNKLGFGRREHEAFLEQVDEGMNFCLWYVWTNMLFEDEESEECALRRDGNEWRVFEDLGSRDPDEYEVSRGDLDRSFLEEDICFEGEGR